MQLSLFLFSLFFFQSVALFIRTYCFTIAGERIVAKLRKDLFQQLILQDIEFFDVNKTGELLNRLASDTKVLESTVTTNISVASRYIIQMFGGIILLFVISWKLTLVMLGVLPFLVLFAVVFGRMVKNLSKGYQDSLAGSSDVAEESLSNVRTIKSFGQELKQDHHYSAKIQDSYEVAKKLAIANSGFGSIMMFFANISMIGVLWYGGILVLDKELTIGTLTSFIVYTLFVAFAFGALSGLFFDVVKAIGATERIYTLLHSVPKIPRTGGRQIKLEGKIEFKDVHFTYPARKDQKILHGVNLKLEPGKVLALVGESGGGKSTISSLIQRYYDVDQGEILIDDVPLKDLDFSTFREQIASVSQEPCLFAYSIAENISFGTTNQASLEEIMDAAKQANAHDFIMELKDGYQTLVGERGIRLSVGQKQRVAIARALLKNPKILLLDEFTSALDSQSEFLVQQALERLMKGRTTLIIAHRLATVKNANEVCVIEKGKIVERGTYQGLVEKNGLFSKLVERQSLL